jgi:hypothetical protein
MQESMAALQKERHELLASKKEEQAAAAEAGAQVAELGLKIEDLEALNAA